jgi:hypothetical protein
MNSRNTGRRLMAVLGGAALIGMGALTACGNNGGNQTPTPSSTTTTTPPPVSTTSVSPTEKNLSPNGGNLFTPTVLAPPAPTEPPGVHRHKN